MSEYSVPTPGPNNIQDILAIPPDEIAQAFPSSQAGVDLIGAFDTAAEQAINKTRYQPGEDIAALPQEEQDTRATRSVRREVKSSYSGPLIDVLRSGTQYAATFDDPAQAKEAIKASIERAMDPFAEGFMGLVGRIADEVPFVQQIRQLSQQAVVEIGAARESGAAASYRLTKMLATEIGTDIWDGKQARKNWRPNHVLARLAILGGIDLQESLATELRHGAFDEHIANDLLHAANTVRPLPADLSRIRQLSDFTLAVARLERPDEAFEAHIAALVDQWPAGERQLVVSAQDILLGGMKANFGLALQRLKDMRFMETGNLQNPFEWCLSSLLGEYLNHVQLGALPPEHRIAFAAFKAGHKRRSKGVPGTTTKRRRPKEEGGQAAAETEKREPPKLVTCNLADGSTMEGVQSLIDDFVTEISQGTTTIAEEAKRMFDFMIRVDLPPMHRRGLKMIRGIGVKFGEQVHELWEFKPGDAAGLSLRTAVVKDSRIYFIKLPDNTLGIIGLKSRSKQAEFLLSVKSKIRPSKR